MPPKTLSLSMARTWWEYAAMAAAEQKSDAAINAMRGPLKAPGDLRDSVAVSMPENAARGVLAAVKGKGWVRTAAALSAAIQQAQTGGAGCSGTGDGSRQDSGTTTTRSTTSGNGSTTFSGYSSDGRSQATSGSSSATIPNGPSLTLSGTLQPQSKPSKPASTATNEASPCSSGASNTKPRRTSTTPAPPSKPQRRSASSSPRKRSGQAAKPKAAKAKPDPAAEMREALRLMYEAGELSDDEIAAAKAKGML